MNVHVPEPVLERFALGDMGESEAEAIAVHLDACPSCAARAAGLEPLAVAFAALDDPPVPTDLSANILAAARAPQVPVARPEITIAAGLAALAALAVLMGGAPTELMASTLALGRALVTVANALVTAIGVSAPLWAAVAVVSLVASAALARSMEIQRRSV